MTIRVIWSDLGNVVLFFDYHLILNHLSKLSGTVSPEEVQSALWTGRGNKPWCKFFCGKISNEDFYRLCCNLFDIKAGYDEFYEGICNIFYPNAKVIDLWTKLIVRGYPLILLSNLDMMSRDWVRKYYKLPPFRDWIWSCEVGCAKPDRRIYEIALIRSAFHFNARLDEIVFVDDKEENTEAAKLLGVHTILYTGDNERLFGELRALGVRVD